MLVTRSPSRSVYATPCLSIVACALAERSCQTVSRVSSSRAISSRVTGAPASPSMQHYPLQASRSQQNSSVSMSVETSIPCISTIILYFHRRSANAFPAPADHKFHFRFPVSYVKLMTFTLSAPWSLPDRSMRCGAPVDWLMRSLSCWRVRFAVGVFSTASMIVSLSKSSALKI